MDKFTTEDLNVLKETYPKRAKGKAYGWPKAFTEIQKRIKEGHSWGDILQGTKDYCAATKLSGDYGTEFIKMASTFYGVGLHFLDEYEFEDAVPEVRYRKPQELTEEQKAEDIRKWEEQMKRFRGV